MHTASRLATRQVVVYSPSPLNREGAEVDPCFCSNSISPTRFASPHLSCIWHDIFPLLRIEGRDSFSCLFRVCWFRLDSVVLIRNIWKNTPGKEVTSIHIANAKQEKFPFLYLMAFSFRWSYCRAVATVRWYFEPSQPQRITSWLKTMFNLSPIYSARKSSNPKLSINHKFSSDTNLHRTKHTQT